MGNVADDHRGDSWRRATIERARADGIDVDLLMLHELWHIEYGTPPSLQIGTGETIPPSYLQARARALFLAALHQLVPESTADLLTPAGLQLIKNEWRVQTNRWHFLKSLPFDGSWTIQTRRDYEPLIRAQEVTEQYISAWQEQYGLYDLWIASAARTTLDTAERMQEKGAVYRYPLTQGPWLEDPHDGKGETDVETPRTSVFRYTPPHKLIDVPVYLEDLKHPPYAVDGYELEDEGELGSFDPRTETARDAEARILEELRPRLRRALDSIAAEDREENGAIKPKAYETPNAFQWLVRFQVMGERKSEIASAAGVDGSRVRKAVKETADLIGLTLREEKGGRPKGRRDRAPRSNVIRVTRRTPVSDT